MCDNVKSGVTSPWYGRFGTASSFMGNSDLEHLTADIVTGRSGTTSLFLTLEPKSEINQTDRKYGTKVVKHINPISSIKTFTKPNHNQCI